jgi:hypothetical protein
MKITAIDAIEVRLPEPQIELNEEIVNKYRV